MAHPPQFAVPTYTPAVRGYTPTAYGSRAVPVSWWSKACLSDWWQPWAYGGYSVASRSSTSWNTQLYLPYMNPYEQSQAAQYLYGIGGQGTCFRCQRKRTTFPSALRPPFRVVAAASWWRPESIVVFCGHARGQLAPGVAEPGRPAAEARHDQRGAEALESDPHGAAGQGTQREFQQLWTSLYSPHRQPEVRPVCPLGRYVMPYRTRAGSWPTRGLLMQPTSNVPQAS
jgi:hypothetical protein